MTRRISGALGAVLIMLCGCATVPVDPAARAAFEANNDPLEPLNRRIFAFNQLLDRFAIKPMARGYVRVVPDRGREAIRNFLGNLHEPVALVNNMLQGELRRAGTTAGRFAMNSTLGLAGLFDVATSEGLPHQGGDFGQTISAWGAREGPYLVLPLLGPSSPRDALGMGADFYMNPLRYALPNDDQQSDFSAALFVLDGVDRRARTLDTLDELQREAVDLYASMRSLYRQNRAAELRHGKPAAGPRTDDLYDDPGDAALESH